MSDSNPTGPAMIQSPDLKTNYANLVRIGHTPMDVVFDFACLIPGQAQTEITSRVVMSPLGAKLFLRALAENVARYEANFGEIRMPGDGPDLVTDLFKGVNPHG